MITTRIRRQGLLGAFFLLCGSSQAEIPANYYDSANTSSAQALKQSLHEIIDDHTRIPYTSSATDTWDVLEIADQDPNNTANVITIYKNASYAKQGGGNSFYNREHSWPKSYGFPNDGSSNYPYTDLHHLFIADSSYNSSRSNKPYASCDSGCSEKITEVNAGTGGQGGDWSNWTAGSNSTGSWETWYGKRGNVARALMYMAVRYEGGSHQLTGHSEPDLILTDDRNQIASSSSGSNASIAYMGLKSVLIQWHKDDPVDDAERLHNDTVYNYQGNRNPFVDHPEWVTCVFESQCSGGSGDSTPPVAPTGLSATGGDKSVSLSWTANTESDLAGYHVYRAANIGGPYTRMTTSLLTATSYQNSGLSDATTYYYVVAAVDTSSNQSSYSSEVSATTNQGNTNPPASGSVWINEIHYDNTSTDSNEFLEVAGAAGTDLAGWSVIGYNGNGGASYKTVSLSGSFTDQQNGYGTKSFAFSGMQNGAPDGLALVNNNGEVIQFISYEGSFTATNGVANGMTSVNIGVSETSSTPVGYSLQLNGSGNKYSDFTWSAAAQNTSGNPNTSQTFVSSDPVNQAPTASFAFSCTDLSCSFDGSSSSDSDGTIQSYAWNFGDSQTSSLVSPQHSFASAGDYTVELTVIDDKGACHQVSQTVSVTAPINQAPTANFSFVANELVVDFTDSSSDPEGGLASWSWNFGDGNSSTTKSPSHQYASAGTYSVTLTVADSQGLTNSIAKSVSVVSSGPSVTPLANDTTVQNLSGNTDEQLLYSFEVPSDGNSVTITMSGGTGDADLYVKKGALPNTGDYECRPYKTGNEEVCSFTTPGTYYIMLNGYSSFSGVSLTGSYKVAGAGYTDTITDISVARREWKYYQVDVVSGMNTLIASIQGGSGDADLYLKFGSAPTSSSYNCRPYLNGNHESCQINTPSQGTWYIGVYGYRASSGITLTTEVR